MIIIPSIDSPNQNEIKVEHTPNKNKPFLEQQIQELYDKNDNSTMGISVFLILLLIGFVVFWIYRLTTILNAIEEAKYAINLVSSASSELKELTQNTYDICVKTLVEWIFIGIFFLSTLIILLKTQKQINNQTNLSEVINIKVDLNRNLINKLTQENHNTNKSSQSSKNE